MLTEETCFDAKEPRNQAANSKLEIKCVDLEISSFPNKLSSNNSMNETGSSHIMVDVEKNNEMNMKRPDYVSGQSRLSDIIEILDDDHE